MLRDDDIRKEHNMVIIASLHKIKCKGIILSVDEFNFMWYFMTNKIKFAGKESDLDSLPTVNDLSPFTLLQEDNDEASGLG